MFSGSRKTSSNTTTTSLLPTPQPTLLVTPTTSTDIINATTTVTESAVHWFSLPYWRRRNVSQPTSPLRRASENSPTRLATSHSSRLLSLDKALPPTPSNEVPDTKKFGQSEFLQHRSSQVSTADVQNTSQSAPVPAPALQGLCISFSSTSAPVQASTPLPNTFLCPSPFPELSNASPQIRRTKSSHRLRAPNDAVASEQLVQRRRRGLSFGSKNLLVSASDTTSKGKGKELEPSPKPSKLLSQPLSRRPSFWSTKKSPTPSRSPPQKDSVVTVLPLPLVDVSPFAPEFTIEPFQTSNPSTRTTIPSPFQRLQSDNATTRHTTPGSTTTSSTTSFDVVGAPLLNSEAAFMPRPARGYAPPPLLHRLSFGVFSSPEPSPIVRQNFPVQYHSQSAPVLPFPFSPKLTPRPSKDNESPEGYVLRLKTHVSKAEVASVLASSSDIFYMQALKAYLDQFEFSGIPLDVALRKLLMEVGLPRETQQIDRVMEAFAFRYRLCNPNLFTSDDHPYILAFSLIMLHTDAFNRSNKRKMTKADYIKNTKLPGVPTEVLDCFFDNIVFAPFIFIEDSEDNSSGLTVDLSGSVSTSQSLPSAGMTTSFKTTNKVDPYYLIMNDLLAPLRVDVNFPLENPFTYEGTNGPWDEDHLHNAFLKAPLIDMELPLVFRSMFSLHPNVSAASPDSCELHQETCRLKVIKGGVLSKKDDLVEGGKKALSRKWKTWGVILSGSHLLFCRDPTSASLPWLEPGGGVNNKLRPDEIYSLKDSIAVYDHSYKKYNHAFKFLLPDGRQLLLQAANDDDLRQWISCINYVSTFKSVGVRMRPADISVEDIHPTCATPVCWQNQVNGQRRQSCRAHITSNESVEKLTWQAQSRLRSLPRKTSVDDLQSAQASPATSDQFKATFKTDLAISTSPVDEVSLSALSAQASDCMPGMSPRCLMSNKLRIPPRSQLALKKIRELDTKIAALQSHLESDERHARNVAILTPFRKTTRSKLLSAIQNLAKPLMRMRLEMEKLKCYRTVLHSDLISESRLRIQTERTPLRIAIDPVRLRRPNTAPPMTSPTYDGFGNQSGILASTPASLTTPTSESFHSARESAYDWPSEFAGDSSQHSLPKADFHKPDPSKLSSDTFRSEHEDTLFQTSSLPSQNNLKDRGVDPRQDSTSENGSQGDDDDQAEDWNKTRVAQRVSLIHVPSDFAIAARLKAVLEGNNQ